MDNNTMELQKRAIELIRSYFPIKANGRTLSIKEIKFTPPSVNSIQDEEELKEKEGTLEGNVKASFTLKDKDGKEYSKPLQIIAKLPTYSKRNTLIVKGNEINVINQLRSMPGVYVTGKGEKTQVADITFTGYTNGPRLQLELKPQEAKLILTIKGANKNFDGLEFCRIMGLSNADIAMALGNGDLAKRIFEKPYNTKTKLQDIYKALTRKFDWPGEEEAKKSIRNFFTKESKGFGEMGKRVIKENLGVESQHMNKDVLIAVLTKLAKLNAELTENDSKDDLRFQQALNGNDQILSQLSKGLQTFSDEMEKKLNEKSLRESDVDKDVFVTLMTNQIKNISRPLNTFLSTSELAQFTEQTNPLHVISSENTITKLGKEAVKDKRSVTDSMRNLSDTAAAKIDPFETPESGSIGVVQHLTQNASIKNGEMYTKYYKVKDGKFKETTPVELSTMDEYNHYVAFNDPRYVKDGIITSSEIRGRYKGQVTYIPKEKIEYIDSAPQNILSLSVNNVPFANHDDGNRLLMGAGFQKQAMALKHREVPLVRVIADKKENKTYQDVVADQRGFMVKSNVAGTVTSIQKNKIVIADANGKKHEHEMYHYFPLNHENFINNEPVVNVGDKVKKGQLLADGWQTKNGTWAPGINTKVGYMAYKGYNYEDGVVISQSLADKMASQEMFVFDKTFKIGAKVGAGSNIKLEFKKVCRDQNIRNLADIDNDGMIKPGSNVKAGDILIMSVFPLDKNTMGDAKRLDRLKRGVVSDFEADALRIPASSYAGGTVKKIVFGTNGEGNVTVRVYCIMSKPMKVGDKTSGRHGNKGTITKILPDKDMPFEKDGDRLDMILSPLGIPSRKNPGQLLEVHSGLIASKKGEPFNIENFDEKNIDKVMSGLKEIGRPDGKTIVIDPESGKPYENPVTTGTMYMMRLKHKVDDKIQSRNYRGKISSIYLSPEKQLGEGQGLRQNPQRLGEMEMRALQAHKAVYNILECATLKGDGAGDRRNRYAIFNALADDGKIDMLEGNATPESVKILHDAMKALNFNMQPIVNGRKVSDVKGFDRAFSSVALSVSKTSDIEKALGKNAEVTRFSGSKRKESSDDAKRGGIFDPEIFGTKEQIENGTARRNWGYIKLKAPMPNPILLNDSKHNPYSLLTGITKDKLKKLAKDGDVIITNPGKSSYKVGDVITADQADKIEDNDIDFEFEVGTKAIYNMLKKADVNELLKQKEKSLKESKNMKDKEKLYKQYKMLQNFKAEGLEPTDLMMTHIPVLPMYLRPRTETKDQIIDSDLNELYEGVLKRNEHADLANDEFDYVGSTATKSKATVGLYRAISRLYGADEDLLKERGKNGEEKEKNGLKQLLSGKTKLVRGKMLSKRVDYSGRSVIGVDPTLDLDQVALPFDMAKNLYHPLIAKKMVDKGVAESVDEANAKIQAGDSDTFDTLNRLIKEDKIPVMLNRAPSLHKLSIEGFYPVIKKEEEGAPVRNINLNPLCVTAFNADFDGDQMAVHLPLTQMAQEEVREKMMPSQNFVNITNGSIIVEIRHEMALGIYYMTLKKSSGVKAGKFASWDELFKAYKERKVGTFDEAELNGTKNTVGKLLFQFCPPGMQLTSMDMVKPWNKKALCAKIDELYKSKKLSNQQLSNLFDNLKKIGFAAATVSGTTISAADLIEPTELKKHVEGRMKEINKAYKKGTEEHTKAVQDLEKEIEDKYKNESDSLTMTENMRTILNSGARADGGQLRRMSDMMGTGMDVTFKTIAPVEENLIGGMSPSGMFLHGYDARKGMKDRVVSTSDPGELTREVQVMMQDVKIIEKDCGTTEGVYFNHNSNNLIGRFTLESIVGDDGNIIVRKGSMIKKADFDRIAKDNKIKQVFVRSTLKCKCVNGVCQKCYGAMPGTEELPELGEPVGTLATHALGEPTTQMTMNTFHSGGANSGATMGLPRVKELLTLNSDVKNPAIIARKSGVVRIVDSMTEGKSLVSIGDWEFKVDTNLLRVKDGDTVEKGEPLTASKIEDMDLSKGSKFEKVVITSLDPKSILNKRDEKASFVNREGVNDLQDYLVNGLDYSFARSIGAGKLDRRHNELIVSKMTSKAQIIDPGHNTDYLPGQIVDKNALEIWNETEGKKLFKTTVGSTAIGRIAKENIKDPNGDLIIGIGEQITPDHVSKLRKAGVNEIKNSFKQIKFEGLPMSKNTVWVKGHDNWLSNIAARDVMSGISGAAMLGQKDNLTATDSRMVAGKKLSLGEDAFLESKHERTKHDAFSTDLRKLFEHMNKK